MARSILIYLAILWCGVFCPLSAKAQQDQLTNSNIVEVVFTTESGHVKMQAENILASYEPTIGCFKFETTIDKLEAVANPKHDQKLWKIIQKDMQNDHLVIRIYIENDPLDLNDLEGDAMPLLAKVDFGGFTFNKKAKVWSWMSDDNLIIRFTIHQNFDPPELFGEERKTPVDQMEFFTEHMEIYDFLNQLN